MLLGGILTDVLNWHWIFLVNVPVGFLVLGLTFWLIPGERVATAAQRLDIAGAVTVTAALMIAVYAIVNGNEVGWTTPRTLGLLAVAAGLLGAFLVIESRVKSPLVPLGLFRLRNVSTANAIGVFWAAAMFAWFFMSALYLQLVLGYSPLEVGLTFLPANLIMGAFSIVLSAKLVLRFGIKPPLVAGLGLAAVGLALFARAPVDGNVAHRCPAQHDSARHRRRDGLQPRAAGRDERCRAGRGRARLRRRQHVVHDGRRARARGAGEPRGQRAPTRCSRPASRSSPR